MGVILRYWRGWTTPDNADAYETIVSEQVLPGIATRGLDGYHGATCFGVILIRRSSSQP
jgi:hypothetical protein